MQNKIAKWLVSPLGVLVALTVASALPPPGLGVGSGLLRVAQAQDAPAQTPPAPQESTTTQAPANPQQKAQADYEQGLALLEEHHDKEARPLLEEAVQLNPANADAYTELGVVYDRLGLNEQSVAATQQAIQLKPNNSGNYRNLGIYYVRLKRFEEGIAAFKQAIKLNPNDIASYSGLGRLYDTMMRRAEATAIFQQAVLVKPRGPEARPAQVSYDYLQRGQAWRHLGQTNRAVSDFNEAFRLDPNSMAAFYARGLAYLTLGRGAPAAAGANELLDTQGWRSNTALFVILVAYFGYRMAGQEAKADQMLADGEAKANAKAWPFPVIRYLRHEITKNELLVFLAIEHVKPDNDKLTDAHAYIGLALALSGKRGPALTHLHWVEQNGNASFGEYQVARAALHRLEHPTTTPTH